MINKFIFYSDYSFNLNLPPLFTSSSVSGTIDWGDGTITNYVYGINSHNYNNGGTYVVTYTSDGGTEIGNACFYNNSYLISCKLSDELTSIGSGTFANTTNFVTLNVPYNCVLQNGCCSNSTSLKKVTFGSNTQKSNIAYNTHGYASFYGCSNLTIINYYTNDNSLLGTKINNYFAIDSSNYFTINFINAEIRNMRIGSHMPSFKHINIERNSKVIYKMALGNRIIWNLHNTTFKEHLKVDSYYIGEKFLESYTEQSVYTSVYWIHEVDGVEIETQLSTSELYSWQCETLEPYYYNDNGRQYVGYYQIPIGKNFGEHNMKITYKSPDTENILEIEYPIYHLQEKSWSFDENYDWYPFRLPFAYPSSDICNSTLHFECYDKNNNLIEDNITFKADFYKVRYNFPDVENAQFKLGENQKFIGTYISNHTLKTYSDVLLVNVRHYQDKRNTQKNCSYVSSTINSYYYKDISPMRITYNFDSNRDFLRESYVLLNQYNMINPYDNKGQKIYATENNIWKKNNMIEFNTYDNDNYNYYVLATYNTEKSNSLNRDFFEFIHNDDELLNIFNDFHYITKSQNNIVDLTDFIIGTKSQIDNALKQQNVASCGFIYWGDGTLSFASLSDSFYNPSNIYANKTGTIKYNDFNTLKLRNGTTLSNNIRTINYDFNMFETSHEYINDGIFNVDITNFFGYEIINELIYMSFRVTKDTNGRIQGNYFTPLYYDEINDSLDEDSILEKIKNGENTNMTICIGDLDGEYSKFAIIDNTGAKNIIEFDFGKTCFFGLSYNNNNNNNNISINNGFEDFVKFVAGKTLNNLSDCKIVHLQKLEIDDLPSDIKSSYTTYTTIKSHALNTIYYNGTITEDVKDWIYEQYVNKINCASKSKEIIPVQIITD